MKLRIPFNMMKNVLTDIRTMNDFSYTVPNETRDAFLEEKMYESSNSNNLQSI